MMEEKRHELKDRKLVQFSLIIVWIFPLKIGTIARYGAEGAGDGDSRS